MDREAQPPVQSVSDYPLQRHIALLLLTVVIVVTTVLGGYSYYRGSQLILSASQSMFEQIASESAATFKNEYQPISIGIELLANTDIGLAATSAERLEYLPLLTTALGQNPSLSSVLVGYHSGDFFIVRDLSKIQLDDSFTAPDNSRYMVDSIIAAGQARQLHRHYFDASLVLLEQESAQPSEYDVLQRDWFKQSAGNDTLMLSEPYKFFLMDQIGITLSRASATGSAVVAGDITLASLSQWLAQQNQLDASELLIFDQQGRVVATPNLGHLSDAGSELVMIDTMASSLWRAIGSPLMQSDQQLQFEYQGETWLGTVQSLYQDQNFKLLFAGVAPRKQLLSVLYDTRQQAIFIVISLIIIMLPISFLLAHRVSRPLQGLIAEAERISVFDFTEPAPFKSSIREINTLSSTMTMMRQTINQFLIMVDSLANEQNFDALLEKVSTATMEATEGVLSAIYLLDEGEDNLQLSCLMDANSEAVSAPVRSHPDLHTLPLANSEHAVVECFNSGEVKVYSLEHAGAERPMINQLKAAGLIEQGELITIPLNNRFGTAIGVLFVVVPTAMASSKASFLQLLSGFAAVSIESKQLLQMQKLLLESFIQLIAGAIDAKSPYTGGHCQRVPELTKMIVQAACDTTEGEYADYQRTEEQWEAIHIGAWLHDCGKVTTPEYVVDKSTKLETIYDRLHEVRMRFEVLKRDAEIRYLKQSGGAVEGEQWAALEQERQTIDQQFAFIASCNLGAESMDQAHIDTLHEIGEQTWLRTLPDNIGLSWEELNRATAEPQQLPVHEQLLSDKPRHIIARGVADQAAPNLHGFTLVKPPLKYNRGERYNLQVARGTLTAEERYVINEHMVQTISMLKKLPFPKYLSEVTEIAGGHHETMDGKGYPRSLTKQQMPASARMMAIADIFEALTASDRPYKTAKPVSQSLDIMSGMARRHHIDEELFELFLREKVYVAYAKRYLQPEQLDTDDYRYTL